MRSASYQLSGLTFIMIVGLMVYMADMSQDTDELWVLLVPQHMQVERPEAAVFPQKQVLPFIGPSVFPPFLGSSVIGFKEALALKESSGNYFEVNSLGYLGRYQFGIGTLKTVGIYDSIRFLKDTKLQEKAFYTNLSRNKWILRKDIERFAGRYINGIEVTESGILAAAHLAGPGNVKRFLRSQGALNVTDSYGTSLSCYLKQFSGYDLSEITAIRNPSI